MNKFYRTYLVESGLETEMPSVPMIRAIPGMREMRSRMMSFLELTNRALHCWMIMSSFS